MSFGLYATEHKGCLTEGSVPEDRKYECFQVTIQHIFKIPWTPVKIYATVTVWKQFASYKVGQ